jgi:hypothetical protein
MATIDTSGRPAYMYDEDTDTWYAVSGRVSTSANYIWTGAQQFTNNVRVDGGLTVTSRINSFLNPAARTAAISSPQTGLITFLQQDAGGNTINRFEYWNGSSWVGMPDLTSAQTLSNKTLASSLFSSPEEVWNIVSASATTTTTVDYVTAQNWYYTAESTAGACTLNIRGNSTTTLNSVLANNQSATLTFGITTGASTPAYFNAVQIDGTATGVSTRWQYANTPTSGTTSGVDMYSFTVVKTAATPTYTVFASVSRW